MFDEFCDLVLFIGVSDEVDCVVVENVIVLLLEGCVGYVEVLCSLCCDVL